MADIDPSLIGKVFHSIDYADVIGTPLQAAIDTQIKSSNATAEFVMKLGFSTNPDTGEKSVINAQFKHGDDVYEMPFITMIPIPNVQILEGEIELDVEISQSAAMKENIEAGGEAEGSMGWGPFKVKVKARASYSKENTRKSDTRAKQHIRLKIGQAPLPEGINLLLERLRNASNDPRKENSKITAE